MKTKKAKEPKPAPPPPSEEFVRAFVGSGHCVCECACGRVHFDPTGNYDWEKGELEELERKIKLKPDLYFAHNDSVEAMHIDGHAFVVGCPCNRARPYEVFIWDHKERIAEYLKAMWKLKLAEAEAASLAAKLIQGIHECPEGNDELTQRYRAKFES